MIWPRKSCKPMCVDSLLFRDDLNSQWPAAVWLYYIVIISSPVCYSLRVWAVCWLPPPPVLPQLQLEVVKGSQGWFRSLQGSLCPQCLPSLQHLDLARRQQMQIPHSQTQAHMRSATANVKVRKSVPLLHAHLTSHDCSLFFTFVQPLSNNHGIVITVSYWHGLK